MGFREINVNPDRKRVGDCVIRALSAVLDQSWEETYAGVAVKGMEMHDMPSSNAVWGAYLRGKGYKRSVVPNTCPDCYTVRDFCADHPSGRYVLCISGHVVAAIDGNYYDTWDSGGEIPVYYFSKEEE